VNTSTAQNRMRAPLVLAAAALAILLVVVTAWATLGRLRAKAHGDPGAGDPRTADPRAGDSSYSDAGRAEAGAATLHVPRAPGPIAINAETEGKPVWNGEVGNTGNLKDGAGQGMVPYTQAKVRWDDGNLYFMLYAGDLDLEGLITRPDVPLDGDDSFRLEFESGAQVRVVAVSVRGAVYDAICDRTKEAGACDTVWRSGAKVAVDTDGTLNHIGDNDEEWVVEMALPFAALGIARPAPGLRIPVSIRRCEVGHDGVHACGGWATGTRRGELILDP
jgi:hypothetical protein